MPKGATAAPSRFEPRTSHLRDYYSLIQWATTPPYRLSMISWMWCLRINLPLNTKAELLRVIFYTLHWLIDWMIEWLIDWLIDWWTHSFIYLFIYILIDWFIYLCIYSIGNILNLFLPYLMSLCHQKSFKQHQSRECKKAPRSKFMSSGIKKKSAIHGHLLSRYDQVPFWIFSLKMCSSPISTNDICSLCEVVRAFLYHRDSTLRSIIST